MALTEDETIQYTAWLTEAQNAFHSLQIGGAVRLYVDQNGERVQYTGNNTNDLRAYIISLKIALGLPTGLSGPLKFGFK